jgi:hypothetical protein
LASPLQQSAEREVAFAVLSKAAAVRMIKRYFIIPPILVSHFTSLD